MNNFLNIDDIFLSIQGEGSTLGKPSIFLRMAGCNLKCQWATFDKKGTFNCDTDAQTDPNKYVSINDEKLSFYEIIKRMGVLLENGKTSSLIITGGEPLIQQKNLVKFLKEEPYTNWREIETNGTIIPQEDLVPMIDQYNISPKLESSGNKLKLRERPNAYLNYMDLYYGQINVFFKFVVVSLEDIEEIQRLQKTYGIPSDIIYLMPEGVDPVILQEKYQWIAEICKKEGYNMTTRLQVLTWGNKRGT